MIVNYCVCGFCSFKICLNLEKIYKIVLQNLGSLSLRDLQKLRMVGRAATLRTLRHSERSIAKRRIHEYKFLFMEFAFELFFANLSLNCFVSLGL